MTSRLRHLKKFATLDNNQRIDALYQTIEEIVGGASGETPDVTHHHDDRYLTRGEADERAGYVEVRIVELERDRVANVERDTKLDHRVAVLEMAYGGGALPVEPAPVAAPAVPAIDPSIAAELTQRLLRIEQLAVARPASAAPPVIADGGQVIAPPDERVDGLINDVATAIHAASAIRDELAQLQQRVAGAEQRIAQPSSPANDDHDGDDLPAFLQRGRGPAAGGVQMAPAHQIAIDDALSRIDLLEQAISRMGADVRSIPRQQPDLGPLFERLARLENPVPAALPPPMERIAAAVRRRAEQGPPVRVAEAAILARNGQEKPIQLMQEIAQAQGCGWEDSARDIIRAHDRATEIAARAYAVECEARRRITAGESAEGVAAAALAALEAIGG